MANYTRFQLRGDTRANWLSANPVLAEREPALETDTNRFKIGDGVSTYSQLSYGRNTGEYASVYNVTSLYPLPSGFYEHSTAILAVPSGERALGLIITYETASGVWYTERFIGIDVANWVTLSNWEKVPDAGDLAQLRSDLNEIGIPISIVKNYNNDVADNTNRYLIDTQSITGKVITIDISNNVSAELILRIYTNETSYDTIIIGANSHYNNIYQSEEQVVRVYAYYRNGDLLDGTIEFVVLGGITSRLNKLDASITSIDNNVDSNSKLLDFVTSVCTRSTTLANKTSVTGYYSYKFEKGQYYIVTLEEGTLGTAVYLKESGSSPDRLQQLVFSGNKCMFQCLVDNANFILNLNESEPSCFAVSRTISISNDTPYKYNVPFEQGAISEVNGSKVTSEKRIRTIDYIQEYIDCIILRGGYRAYLVAYDQDNYVGFWDGTGFSANVLLLSDVIMLSDFRKEYNYSYKLVLFVSGNPGINMSFVHGAIFCNYTYYLKYTAQNERIPIITFIDDDGRQEQLINWERIYNKTGVKPSMALITDLGDKVIGDVQYFQWNTIRRLINLGFDFISHSHTHPSAANGGLLQLTTEELDLDLSTSVNTLLEKGITPKYLAYPGNRYFYEGDAAKTRVFQNIIKKHFRGAVAGGVIFPNPSINIPPIANMQLKRISFLQPTTTPTDIDGSIYNIYKPYSLSQYLGLIDALVEKKGWVIFMTHFRNSLNDGYMFDDSYIDLIVSICRYAKQKGVAIKTLDEGYEVMKNQYSEGVLSNNTEITTDTYYIVDCDGGLTYKK